MRNDSGIYGKKLTGHENVWKHWKQWKQWTRFSFANATARGRSFEWSWGFVALSLPLAPVLW